MLVAAAAEAWGVSPSSCGARDGHVVERNVAVPGLVAGAHQRREEIAGPVGGEPIGDTGGDHRPHAPPAGNEDEVERHVARTPDRDRFAAEPKSAAIARATGSQVFLADGDIG
jgi:hypothetical protein